MIEEILQRCGYFIKRNKFKFMIVSVTFFSLLLSTSTVSLATDENTLVNITIEEISLLASNDFNLKVQESINETIDGYLKEYSSYYSLDGDKVVEFARNVTDNYSISFNDVNGQISLDNKEGQCMMFVYYLSRDKLLKPLSEYGLSKDYFKVSSAHSTMGKDQILSSGLTFSQFLGKVCDNLGMDKNYLLAISYLETGKNTSGLALRSNNFGGLRGSGEYFSYPSPEVGIIAFVLNLKGYEKYNLSSLSELSGIYTHGNKYNPSSTWISNVNRYYNEITSNPANYFIVND